MPEVSTTGYRGGVVFDGVSLRPECDLLVGDGRVLALARGAARGADRVVDLDGDLLSPGLIDLQVNGGGGVMFNDMPSAAGLRRMVAAHAPLGTATLLPTLITDTSDTVLAAISAVETAVADGETAVAGLHLEGPHLSVARCGAHDPALVRTMTPADLAVLIEARRRLPALWVTVAPESVSLEQVGALIRAGVTVSLGHTDADCDTCRAYFDAGVSVTTHLFNAMRQLGSREPGLVGAVLAHASVSAGLIADGVHVHPTSLRVAWQAMQPAGRAFLVSDAMACAGSELQSFALGARTVHRAAGRLTLDDGTLAGADLDLPRALRVLVERVGVPLDQALRAATSTPADLLRLGAGHGRLAVGQPARLIRFDSALHFKGWP